MEPQNKDYPPIVNANRYTYQLFKILREGSQKTVLLYEDETTGEQIIVLYANTTGRVMRLKYEADVLIKMR